MVSTAAQVYPAFVSAFIFQASSISVLPFLTFSESSLVHLVTSSTLLCQLSIIGQLDITEISPLQDLKQLILLYSYKNNITDIGLLQNLKNLVEIQLSKNQISDITPLNFLHKLQKLYLDDNLIIDLSPLRYLINLETLSLDNNRISDISALRLLVHLKQLLISNDDETSQIGNNTITDISPLKNLVNLNILQLQNNQIVDLSPLDKIDDLTVLNVKNNKVCDLSVIYSKINRQKFSVKQINFRDNYIDDECSHSSEAAHIFGDQKEPTSELLMMSRNMKCFFMQNNKVEEMFIKYYNLKFNFKRNRKTFIEKVSKLNQKLQNIQLYFSSAIAAQFQLYSVCNDQ
ncbi:leucine-rich_repeat domain-containing protein [Hexamita inflata]|uniref:Leucine-rich repeat domain-containing protein n=1 Tax=Hexamita inflata TaxID=28002 RepID=A0AA86R3R3_9EUKA|nr:leucine-rich repeat domain-containing protein [Hexamita inflata]